MGMNPDIKAQWVAALRSGEYRQGWGQLHTGEDDSFCCLGVLCDLAVKAGVDLTVAMGIKGKKYNDNGHTLNKKVQAWAGLPCENPRTNEADEEYDNLELAGLNDNGYSFKQLAAVIERDL